MRADVAARTEISESRLVEYARWSLYVTVGALPLYVVRWHYGPVPTTLLETLIGVTVVLYVAGRWRDGIRRPTPTAYDIPIVLLLVAGVVSIFIARDRVGALGLYRAFFIEPIALFYVAADVLRRRDAIGHAVIAFAAGSSAFALLNFAAFYQAFAANAVHIGDAPSALYNNPNYVAMYMEPAVALATGLVLFAAAPRWRLLGTAWLALCGAALMLSFSKGGYVALAALALLVVVSAPRWRLPLFAILAVAAIAISRVPPIAERLGNTYNAAIGRAEIYGATFAMLREHPIFGLGLGGYNYLFRNRQPTPYPHDIWLAFWVELGVLGLVAFAIILLGLLWRGIRGWPRVAAPWRAAYWGSLAALGLWTVHGIVDTPYWKNDMSVEFWVLAAVQVAILAGLQSRDGDPVKGVVSSSS